MHEPWLLITPLLTAPTGSSLCQVSQVTYSCYIITFKIIEWHVWMDYVTFLNKQLNLSVTFQIWPISNKHTAGQRVPVWSHPIHTTWACSLCIRQPKPSRRPEKDWSVVAKLSMNAVYITLALYIWDWAITWFHSTFTIPWLPTILATVYSNAQMFIITYHWLYNWSYTPTAIFTLCSWFNFTCAM